MMVLFHNIECSNKCNKQKSRLLLLLLRFFPLRLHRLSLRGCHVMNERLKPDDSKVELLNSLPAHTALVELAGLSPDERMTRTR